ncbi:MAG: hypothetical protein JSV04_04975 [Candidatus Heimdallarchaeota archaeon]|nr:MAG: hypothetical protein JSV04_04975 [Candidatus Heimdallarchaeota archaeon]
MEPKKKRRTLFSSASIAAATFNLPVMVIAGIIIGYLLSVNQDSPLREIIMIIIILVFFIIGIWELYYAARKQEPQQYIPSFNGLKKLITENEKEVDTDFDSEIED